MEQKLVKKYFFTLVCGINLLFCATVGANIHSIKQHLHQYLLKKYTYVHTHIEDRIIRRKHLKDTSVPDLTETHFIESRSGFLDFSIHQPEFCHQDRLVSYIYHTTAIEARAGFSQAFYFVWRDKKTSRL